MEAETNRALIAAAGRLVVLADHTKWGTVGISSIAELSEAHVVVSDAALPEGARATLTEHVEELVIVP
jgi:DeoR/GlpR family transcriptional regulator of sugar metabolism